MWDCQAFSDYLKKSNGGHDIYGNKIKPAME